MNYFNLIPKIGYDNFIQYCTDTFNFIPTYSDYILTNIFIYSVAYFLIILFIKFLFPRGFKK